MLSILSSPKNFNGYIGEIQENAIRSWKRVHPGVEICLYGNSSGADEICAKYGLQHVEFVACSPTGAPYFDALARHADAHARYDRHLFINGDILLPPDFCEKVRVVDWAKYLVVGQRIDLHEGVRFDAGTGDWDGEIRRLASQGRLELRGPSSADYFLFTRGTWSGLKPVVIGRGAVDPALIAFCFRNHIPVINGTWSIHAIHQWHDYSHMTGQEQEVYWGAEGVGNRGGHNAQADTPFARQFWGVEGVRNRTHHDVWHGPPLSSDADFALRRGRVVPSPCGGDRLREWEITLRYKLGRKYLSYGLRLLWRALRAAHLLREPGLDLAEAMRG
jgi:hypothetical protein